MSSDDAMKLSIHHSAASAPVGTTASGSEAALSVEVTQEMAVEWAGRICELESAMRMLLVASTQYAHPPHGHALFGGEWYADEVSFVWRTHFDRAVAQAYEVLEGKYHALEAGVLTAPEPVRVEATQDG